MAVRKKQDLEELISLNLKRHNGHRLVFLHENQYAMIYPKKVIIRLGSSRSSALSFWYQYWKNKQHKK